ncbi:DUF3526 domain-containing protein [Microbulbifer sp.]|uniref:DUF3526 domain-containing protein n=1 Tax=Microbulbifer sp. TaxID=1908541 RepID=UPI003F353ECC
MNLVKLETLVFFRSTVTRALLVFYGLLCLLAIFAGHQALKQSAADFAVAEQRFGQQRAHWSEALDGSADPAYIAGQAAYYTFMPTWHQPTAWNGLFPGQRADYNNTMRVRLLAIQGQMNDSALQNYQHAPSGRLDLGFIWVYLLPLLIGVLAVNIVADDQQARRWPLIAASVPSPGKLIFIRLAVRFATLFALNVAVLGLACLLLGIADLAGFGVVTALLLLYQLFWFALVAWLISFNRNRRQNLVYYSALWITLAFLVPGISYLARLDSQELGLAIGAQVEQRESINSSWDKDKQAAFDAYLSEHPEWADTAPLPEGFHWKWYYAMQQYSDDTVAHEVEAYREKRLEQYRAGLNWSWSSPVTGLQLALQRLADTDALAYQDYLDQIVSYHGQLQHFYFPFLFFDNQPTDGIDLAALPRFSYSLTGAGAVMIQVMATLLLLVALLLIAAWRKLRMLR